VRAFLSLKKLRQPESFYAWLLGLAGRVLKEQFRATARRQQERAVAETLLPDEAGSTPEYPLEEAIVVLPEPWPKDGK
jgi:DNA-directed RNA polymerase specialized sigma24 family protein